MRISFYSLEVKKSTLCARVPACLKELNARLQGEGHILIIKAEGSHYLRAITFKGKGKIL